MTRTSRAGLAVLGVLSTLDLLIPLTSDGEHPPMAVALAAAALGAASLVLMVPAWRGVSKAVAALVALRVISALSAVPAFFADGVPAVAIGAAAAIVVLTVVGVSLTLAGMRRSTMVGAS